VSARLQKCLKESTSRCNDAACIFFNHVKRHISWHQHPQTPKSHSSFLSSSFTMLRTFIILVPLLFSIHSPACSAATDTISAGEALPKDEKLVSRNGRFALGFFHPDTDSKFFPRHTLKHWYLGIWFDKIPVLTPIWIANRENPIVGHHRVTKLTIASDGNLAIFNQATRSTVWSTHASITAKKTMVVLQDNGNLILRDASNSSNVLWQSFDYPTDVMLIGAKFGLDKVTGLNRVIVSKKSLADPAAGLYCLELDPTGANQYVLEFCNSSIVYWSTGEWNGQFFNSIPEMSGRTLFDFKFINNNQEKYFVFNLLEKDLITVCFLDISGQMKQLLWLENKQEWATIYTLPKDLCDIYATCGPFTVCNSNALQVCDCIKGFSVRSPKDWELEDRAGGCIRNTPLDCGTKNQSRTATTDKFYSLPGIGLPTEANIIEAARTADQCALACQNNCSCTAYSYGNRCSVWYDDLLNVRV
jgi:hypothetical protein